MTVRSSSLSHFRITDRQESIIWKRKALNLEQKVVLIKYNENVHFLSVRHLAEKYSVSKSSVGNILQRREQYLEVYA